jgi:hypothetical protein
MPRVKNRQTSWKRCVQVMTNIEMCASYDKCYECQEFLMTAESLQKHLCECFVCCFECAVQRLSWAPGVHDFNSRITIVSIRSKDKISHKIHAFAARSTNNAKNSPYHCFLGASSLSCIVRCLLRPSGSRKLVLKTLAFPTVSIPSVEQHGKEGS